MKVTAEEIQKHFPSFEKELLRDIVEVAETKLLKKGEHMMRQGQYIKSVWLILDGLVKVCRENGNGGNYFMHYLEPGHSCALSMMCGTQQRISEITATAFTKTTILAIPLSCMDKWMVEYKSWYQFVFDTFRLRVRELLDTIDSVVFRNMDDRIIFFLQRHQDVLQSKDIPLTRTEIAKELNSSREVVTRILKKLSHKGKLKMHRQYIEILNL